MTDELYTGPVVFVDGVHYPVVGDAPDLTRPLRFVEGTTYRTAEPGDPLHNDTYHEGYAGLEVAGASKPPLQVTAAEYEQVDAFLVALRGGVS